MNWATRPPSLGPGTLREASGPGSCSSSRFCSPTSPRWASCPGSAGSGWMYPAWCSSWRPAACSWRRQVGLEYQRLRPRRCFLAGSSALLAVAWSLFPFIRSDGYWLLCDLLGMDDLDRASGRAANAWAADFSGRLSTGQRIVPAADRDLFPLPHSRIVALFGLPVGDLPGLA